MRIFLVMCSAVVLLCVCGCGVKVPPRYSISVDVNEKLKTYSGAKVHMDEIKPPVKFNAGCRMMGNIKAPDGMTIPEYILDAFNDEFKYAGIYSEAGTTLKADLRELVFSSSHELVNGWWKMSIKITSESGKSFLVSNTYYFSSGFDGMTACNETSDALVPAIQDLILKTVNAADFKELIAETKP